MKLNLIFQRKHFTIQLSKYWTSYLILNFGLIALGISFSLGRETEVLATS